MTSIPETVRTQVDSLAELIKKKKEISFEDAAKKLKLPKATIESWATFLEEEGIISIKYKFTTPFFIYKELKKELITPDMVPFIKVDEVSKLLKEVPILLKEKKFNKAKQIQEKIREILINLPDEFKSEHSDLVSNISEIEKKMNTVIMDFMAKGANYEQKLNEYNYIDKEFGDRVKKLKNIALQTKKALEKPGELPVYEEKAIETEDVRQMLGRVDYLLNKIKECETEEDYDKINALFSELNPRMKGLRNRLKSEIGMEKSLDDRLNKELDLADILFARIKGNMKKNDVELARKDIIKAYNLLTQIYFLLKTIFDEEKLIEKKEIIKAELNYIEPFFKKAYEYMKENKFESAKHIYTQIEEKYLGLPAEFIEKRKALKIDLIKLNRDLAIGMTELTEKQLKSKMAAINKLAKDTLNFINRNDVYSATKVYERIEQIYKDFPQGYLDEKTKLQYRVLELQEKLISKKRMLFFIDLQKKTKDIHSCLNKIQNLLANRKINESINLYQKVRKIFATLPQGFLPEKTDLQNRILDTYRQILYNKTNVKMHEVLEKSKQIDRLLKTIHGFVAKNDIASANKVYNEVEQVYKDLPDGFLIEKSELQNRILKISEEIGKSLDVISSRDFNAKCEKTERIMKNVVEYIKKKDFDLAFAEYEEGINIYNQFPPGFLKRKTEMRERLLNIYKDVMRGTDAMMLSKKDSITVKKYEEILQLLVRMHHHIENREFDLLEANYDHLIELYNDMPIGFLQQKTKIIDEIMDMHKKFELLGLIKKAENNVKNRNFEELSLQLTGIYNLYNELLNRSNQDIQLLNYIYEKYSQYFSFLQETDKQMIKDPRQHTKTANLDKFRERISTTEKRLSNINLEYVKPFKT